jgi:hypothetical protein
MADTRTSSSIPSQVVAAADKAMQNALEKQAAATDADEATRWLAVLQNTTASIQAYKDARNG